MEAGGEPSAEARLLQLFKASKGIKLVTTPVEETSSVRTRIRQLIEDNEVEQLKSLLASMTQEQMEETSRTKKTYLHYALCGTTDIFRAVLNVTSDEVARQRDSYGNDVLHYALSREKVEEVMLLGDRLGEEEWVRICDDQVGRVRDLFLGGRPVIDKRKVRNGLLPSTYFYFDNCVRGPPPLSYIWCEICAEGDEEAWGDILPGSLDQVVGRFLLVTIAAKSQPRGFVKMVLEALPYTAEGGWLRGSREEYAEAISMAAANNMFHFFEVMELLVEEAGDEVLEMAGSQCLTRLWEREHIDWVVSRAPSLVFSLCEQSKAFQTIRWLDDEARDAILGHIADLVDHEAISALLTVAEAWRPWMLAKPQLRKLKVLYLEVRERVEPTWSNVMTAVQRKNYEDAEFFLSLLPRNELARRSEEGRTLAEEARRDEAFPPDLLRQMAVVAKNAYT